MMYPGIGVGAFGVTIVAAIAAIWAFSVLSLVFTLPHEFVAPADPEGETIEPDPAATPRRRLSAEA